MTEQIRKWDAKNVVIGALITMIPITIGLTYNIMIWQMSDKANSIANMAADIKEVRNDVNQIKLQMVRFEMMTKDKP